MCVCVLGGKGISSWGSITPSTSRDRMVGRYTRLDGEGSTNLIRLPWHEPYEIIPSFIHPHAHPLLLDLGEWVSRKEFEDVASIVAWGGQGVRCQL